MRSLPIFALSAAIALGACSHRSSTSGGEVSPEPSTRATPPESTSGQTNPTRDDTSTLRRDTSVYHDTTTRRDTTTTRDTTMLRDTTMHRDTTMNRDTTMHRDTTPTRDTSRTGR